MKLRSRGSALVFVVIFILLVGVVAGVVVYFATKDSVDTMKSNKPVATASTAPVVLPTPTPVVGASDDPTTLSNELNTIVIASPDPDITSLSNSAASL